jgi:hypothetical protein
MKTVSPNTILISVILLFVLSVNGKGQTCEWAEGIEGKDQEDSSIAIDKFGDIYVVGPFKSDILNFNNGKILNNSGQGDGYIAKYNKTIITSSFKEIPDEHYSMSIIPNPAADYIEININSINPTVNHKVDDGSDIQIFDVLGVIQSTPHQFTSPQPSAK